MSKSNFQFKTKFDQGRETFVLLARAKNEKDSGPICLSDWYEAASRTFAEPYSFVVCVPVSDIPHGFSLIAASMHDARGTLVSGITLQDATLNGTSACFTFEFTLEALLNVTPPLYRHWIETVTKAGFFSDLFAQ